MMNKELDNKINQVLSGWNTPSINSKKVIWKNIEGQLTNESTLIISTHTWRWLAAASVFALAITFGLYKTSQVEINAQQATNFTLPDGSKVSLNANSSAAYNSFSWLFKRSVTLNGEGFFKVTKGEKFNVITANGTISVLGTSFNVITRKNKFRVECFTGRVSVNNGGNSTIITKGELVSQSKDNVLVKEINTQINTSPIWLSSDYSYKNELLATVLNDISAHFDIKIERSHKIDKLSFTGAWNHSMTLEEVLKIVCLPFSLESTTKSETSISIDFIED